MVSKASPKEEVKTEVGSRACFVYDKQDDLVLDNVPNVLLAVDRHNMAWWPAVDVLVRPAANVPHAGSCGDRKKWPEQDSQDMLLLFTNASHIIS